MPLQVKQSILRKLPWMLPSLVDLLQESGTQFCNLTRPFPKSRRPDLHYLKAIIQILAETPCHNLLCQMAVRRRNNPDIGSVANTRQRI